MMNIVISIEHPAWAHQFRPLIRELEKLHSVKIVAINKDHSLDLLEKFNLKYEQMAATTGTNVFHKALLLFSVTIRIFRICARFRPDLFVGRASPMMAINSFLFHKPHVVFEDTDHSYISLFFCRLLSTRIITNDSFRSDLGKKHVRINTYKELFYLHPNRFTPDPDVLTEAGIRATDNFIIIRFVGWHADHDIGHRGLSNEMKSRLIEETGKYAKVFISSEDKLPEELEKYRLRSPIEKIHHFLYYAVLLYGESSTMATEAAVLGTHAIFLDYTGRGYTDELENDFGLVYNFRLDRESQMKSIRTATGLLATNNLRETGKQKRLKLLERKIDGTEFMLGEIRKYL
jgi:predicted glycosyltransferase